MARTSQSSPDNLLVALGVQDREDVITNLLAYCIEHASCFRNAFVKSVLGLDPSGSGVRKLLVRHEFGPCTPDLSVLTSQYRRPIVFLIKISMTADVEPRELRQYCSEATRQAVMRDPCFKSVPDLEIRYLLLSLHPFEGEAYEFRTITLGNLLLALYCPPTQKKTVATQLQAIFAHMMRSYYRIRLRPNEPLSQEVLRPSSYDTVFVIFRQFFARAFFFPAGVTERRVISRSLNHNVTHIAQFWGEDWLRPGDGTSDAGRRLFIQATCSSGGRHPHFGFYLRYEPFSDCASGEFERNYPESVRSDFAQQRTAFSSRLRECADPISDWFSVGNWRKRPCQIATMHLQSNIRHVSAAALRDELVDKFARVAAVVDKALGKAQPVIAVVDNVPEGQQDQVDAVNVAPEQNPPQVSADGPAPEQQQTQE